MKELYRQLADSVKDGTAVAYCQLVETRGSTPQKAGAAMLVFPNGGQAGTLGGGCVEAEVKRQALAVLNEGHATIHRFQLDHDYGWDDGLICGGRMTVLVDPLRSGQLPDVLEKLSQMTEGGVGGTLAVVFDGSACGLPETGICLFDSENRLLASSRLDGDPGPAEAAMARQLRPLSERPRPYAVQGVSYLPLLPRCRLLIAGGGHVGQAVASLAAELDFDVWVVDDRPEFVTDARFPTAERRVVGDFGTVLPYVEVTSNTYCLIVTRGHNHDEEALFHLVNRGARYVGMIGSKRKIRMILDDLIQEGISPEALAKVRAPVGFDIGSQTVPEIAVSIAAELVALRNLGRLPEERFAPSAGAR